MNVESVALVSGAALLASAIGAPQAVADRYPDHGSDPASVMLVRVAGAVEVPSVPASTAQRCRDEEVTVRGTVGPDLIVGTAGADVIWGGPGDDTIRGLAGADVVCAGSGNDVVTPAKGMTSSTAGTETM